MNKHNTPSYHNHPQGFSNMTSSLILTLTCENGADCPVILLGTSVKLYNSVDLTGTSLELDYSTDPNSYCDVAVCMGFQVTIPPAQNNKVQSVALCVGDARARTYI